MNRREFITSAAAASLTPSLIASSTQLDNAAIGHAGASGTSGRYFNFIVYCYEREQGEWVFSENVRDDFNYIREYMTPEEEASSCYSGFMDGGKLHFSSLKHACDFIEEHVKTKDDTNLIDSIYDIYYISRSVEQVEVADTVEDIEREVETKVAHFWFNGDTGRQIVWLDKEHRMS